MLRAKTHRCRDGLALRTVCLPREGQGQRHGVDALVQQRLGRGVLFDFGFAAKTNTQNTYTCVCVDKKPIGGNTLKVSRKQEKLARRRETKRGRELSVYGSRASATGVLTKYSVPPKIAVDADKLIKYNNIPNQLAILHE